MNTITVSVIIPSFCSILTIRRCLASVLAQDWDGQVEVMVVDSSPDDQVREAVQEYAGVQLIRLTMRALPGRARNVGAAESQGQVLVFLDADCEARPDWLRMLLVRLAGSDGIVGGAIGNAQPNSLVGSVDHFLTFNEFVPELSARLVHALPAANIACTRGVFEALGGFPEHLPIGEDTAFVTRAAEFWPVWFEPRAVVLHTNRVLISTFLLHQYRFGRYACLLRRAGQLTNKWGVPVRLLAPVAPILRAVRILFRNYQRVRRMPRRMIQFALLFGLGLGAWGWGFMCAALAPLPSNDLHLP